MNERIQEEEEQGLVSFPFRMDPVIGFGQNCGRPANCEGAVLQQTDGKERKKITWCRTILGAPFSIIILCCWASFIFLRLLSLIPNDALVLLLLLLFVQLIAMLCCCYKTGPMVSNILFPPPSCCCSCLSGLFRFFFFSRTERFVNPISSLRGHWKKKKMKMKVCLFFFSFYSWDVCPLVRPFSPVFFFFFRPFFFSHLGADGHVLSFSLTRPRLAAAKFPTVGPASYSSSPLCALVEITPARRDQRHPH